MYMFSIIFKVYRFFCKDTKILLKLIVLEMYFFYTNLTYRKQICMLFFWEKKCMYFLIYSFIEFS